METQLKTLQGTFKLQRFPLQNHEKLRAWDAADEYLLQHLAENRMLSKASKILILNDSFGALAVVLNSFHPVALSDSYLSQIATRHNLASNQLVQEDVELRNSLDWPTQSFDLVLIKVPKTLALLEDQLIRLQTLLTEKSIVMAAGMIKAMSSSVWKLMDQYIGSTKPSLAKKKARLIFISLTIPVKLSKNPYPVCYQLENTSYQICNHANVFSRESLDIGTRFLLQHLPRNNEAHDIVDLGCGNGVVGLMLAHYYKAATVTFIDESYMAIASARQNFEHAFPDKQADFCVADGLIGFASESKDLIVCNPPFHQLNAMGIQIALTLFQQSHRVLRKGGELWVIGNRHLGYHLSLKKYFKHCKEVASNAKFVIWQVKQ